MLRCIAFHELFYQDIDWFYSNCPIGLHLTGHLTDELLYVRSNFVRFTYQVWKSGPCALYFYMPRTLWPISVQILCSTVVAYSLLSCGYLLISIPTAMILANGLIHVHVLAHPTDSAWRYGPFHGRDGSSSALPISVNGQIRCSSYSWPPHLGYLTLLRGRFCNSSKLCSCFLQI